MGCAPVQAADVGQLLDALVPPLAEIESDWADVLARAGIARPCGDGRRRPQRAGGRSALAGEGVGWGTRPL